MLGYPATLGAFKRLTPSEVLAKAREVPEGASTAYPLVMDDIKVVSRGGVRNGTILFGFLPNVSMKSLKISIEGAGQWDVRVPQTVYPPREDTLMLCRVIAGLSTKCVGKALEVGCGSGLVTMVLTSLGWEVTACDLNPYAVSSTRGNLDLNGLPGAEKIFESGIGEGMQIPEDTQLIVWNLPYLDEGAENRGLLEKVEEIALNDISAGGWGGSLLRQLENENSSLCDKVAVILVMRTDPEGNSRISDWEHGGWSWRALESERYGPEKVEVIGFWRTGSGVEATIVESCSSTMDEAVKLDKEGWQRIFSKIQTNGRGRRGSEWISEEGGVFATWNLDSGVLETLSPGLIQTSVGAVISEILSADMKWPNDIIKEDGQKIGGVLLESTNGGPIRVGVGVNKHSFEKDGVCGYGWEETVGGRDASEIFTEIDRALSSIFEDNGVFVGTKPESLVRSSWRALSRSLSRGVTASLGEDLLRPSGLNIRGELEVVDRRETGVIRDLDNVGWVFPN